MVKVEQRYDARAMAMDAELTVLVPGDPERISRERRLREGIPIDATTWREIGEAARALGFASERFDAALRAA